MNALQEIFRYAAIISGNNILTSILNFFTFIVMFNALGAYGFGLLTLAMSVLSIATFSIELGFGKAIVSDVSKELYQNNRKQAAGLFSGYIIFVLFSTALLAGAMYFFSGHISAYFGKDIAPIIQFIAALMFLSGIKTIITSAFHIVADFWKYASFLFADALSKLVLVCIFVAFVSGTVEGILQAFILSGIATIILFLFFIPREILEIARMRSNPLLFFEMAKRHGKWVAVFSQLRSIESSISPWIVEFFLGVNAVGIYGALTKVQVLIIRVFEPLETIFYPLVSRFGNFNDSRKIVFRATKYILFVSLPFIIAAVIFSEYILSVVLGQGFEKYAAVFMVLLLTVVIFILNMPMKPLFFNLKAQKSLTVISAVLLASTLALGSVLAFYFGLIGMAANNVSTAFIDLSLKNRFMKKVSGEKYSIREMLFLDKADIDLAKKIFSDPKVALAAFKRDAE